MHLAMARRFARSMDDPVSHFNQSQFSAAEHYAIAVSLLVDAAERALACQLFLKAAVQARQSGSFTTAERYLRLGVNLLPQGGWQNDEAHQGDSSASTIAFALHAELHLVLYSLSRHVEADALYAELTTYVTSPMQLVDSACVQIVSLSNRTLYGEAVALCNTLLGHWHIGAPTDDVVAVVQLELDRFYALVAAGALEQLGQGSDLSDDRLLAVARLLNRTAAAAPFFNPLIGFWFFIRSACLALEHGYCPKGIASLSAVVMCTITLRGDYVTGCRASLIAVELAKKRQQGLQAARTYHAFSVVGSHWVRPLEEVITTARMALDGLVRAGDFEYACFTYYQTFTAQLDTGAGFAELNNTIEAALCFALKTGNRHCAKSLVSMRQLLRALQGQTHSPGRFDDAEFKETQHLIAAKDIPVALCYFHIYRALSACLFNKDEALRQHVEKAVTLAPYITGFYPTALANLLHSLALIQHIRATTPADSERTGLLERLAANQTWLSARASDAPMNFGHLYDLVEAERLDAIEQPWSALQLFEQAMLKAQGNQRPWHHALITERASQFCMRRRLEHVGRQLLTRAHSLYQAWGAVGKTQAMKTELPFVGTAQRGRWLSNHGDPSDQNSLLRAFQMLASETSLPRLVMRIVELVGQMTGATDVRFSLLDDEKRWILEGGLRGREQMERMTQHEAEEKRLVSSSVQRLALKTLQPIVSDDAVVDRRFDETFIKEWQRTKRLGQPLALVFIDVDLFKKYNDHYGHQAGDMCLKRVAHTICTSVQRAEDLVARYGGEEFVVLLPGLGSRRCFVSGKKAGQKSVRHG